MFRSVPTRRETENSKTTAKKFKKLKNTITGSFEAKIGREKQNLKIIVSFRSCPALNRKFKENSKKIQKIKKHH